ncbi:MAG TPA: YebC/PmpR family DNA-binding transcriptional regulator, partial [Candidatus Goldiibacteriota bacterium]|nr:YebC/PmpR family DNA-binding transcriptional regulator [Candidatus Goldiibacteriota bacterium]
PKEEISEDAIMEAALEAGAQDIKNEDASYDIITEPQQFESVKKALDAKAIRYNAAEITMVPKNYVKLTGQDAERMLKLMSELDDDEDVQNVYSNFDIAQDEMEKISGQ